MPRAPRPDDDRARPKDEHIPRGMHHLEEPEELVSREHRSDAGGAAAATESGFRGAVSHSSLDERKDEDPG